MGDDIAEFTRVGAGQVAELEAGKKYAAVMLRGSSGHQFKNCVISNLKDKTPRGATKLIRLLVQRILADPIRQLFVDPWPASGQRCSGAGALVRKGMYIFRVAACRERSLMTGKASALAGIRKSNLRFMACLL